MIVGTIGIIGAMDAEVDGLIAKLSDYKSEVIGGVKFHTGVMLGKNVVIARCGVGKVFAAMCAEAMIIKYSPDLLVNTGVGGALDPALSTGDIVVATSLCQHDMDTSPLGDPKGFISGIEKIYFDADVRAVRLLCEGGKSLGITVKEGVIASGDVFVADSDMKARITEQFSASVCEMEGAAIAQTAYVNRTSFAVVRAISDGANGDSAVDFPTFLKIAAEKSQALTSYLIENY